MNDTAPPSSGKTGNWRKHSTGAFFSAMFIAAPIFLTSCAPDYVAQKITGRECRGDLVAAGEDWCAPPQRPTPPQPYCTSSWNGVDCWARPELTPNMAQETYQGPRGLTSEQNANRLMMDVSRIPPGNQYFTP